ncbi:MAG TPA: amidohydrolase [Longimicrobium sp.]|nr:amidohydrolase [Longimicrobium sp.]
MTARTRVSFLALSAVIALPAAAQSPAAAPELILTGGKVFTADSTRPWAEAIAISGDRIVAVGTSAEIERRAGRGTRRIDLGGRVVIPGINDAHDHLGGARLEGEFQTGPSPTPDPELAQVLDSVRSLAARARPGAWIKTNVGARILNDARARRAALDSAAPGHPVLLWTWWGHGAVMNSAALRTLGIADGAADPPGGWYERDAAGRLTGRMDEYAEWGALRRLYSSLPDSLLVANLRQFAGESLRMGVTSVQNMAGYADPATTLRAFRAARLPIRVRLIRWPIPSASGHLEAAWETVDTKPAERVVVSGRKWVIDGTPNEQLALSRAPYPGRPGWHGRLNFPLDTVRSILAEALLPGAPQLHMHVVGDSATELVLARMEALAPAARWRELRVRIEHGRGIVGAQVARAGRMGIVIAQPRGGAPLQTWRAAGIPMAYGSDGLRNPFLNLMVATTSDEGGRRGEPLSREQAVTMYTLGSAYAEFAEREKGRLAPGMLADLAVLSQDIFTVPARALPGTVSVLTIVGGRVAYQTGPFAAVIP